MTGTPSSDLPAERRLQLRFAGTCVSCGAELPKRAWALYAQAAKTVRCIECPGVIEIDHGLAGGSAQREFERRKSLREARVKKRLGNFLGGVVVAVTDEPQTTRSWARGAVGEQKLGAALQGVQGLQLLHDRRVPGKPSNIDHVVIAPAGVFVVDAKRYQGLIEVRDRGGLFSSAERLFVGGRDRSHLAEDMAWQVEAVRDALSRAGGRFIDVPITPVLCFIDGEWPLLFPPSSYRGVRLEGPRSIKRLITRSRALDSSAMEELARIVAAQLPAK